MYPFGREAKKHMDTLTPDQELRLGASLESMDGQFSLQMQRDGNLVIYKVAGGRALWATHTDGYSTARAVMQGDGNFVLYTDHDQPVWSSATDGHSGSIVKLQDDGNLVVYKDAVPLWASGTSGNQLGARLLQGETLHVGEEMRSPNMRYGLRIQGDDNVVLYRVADGKPLWASNTVGSGGKAVTMQADGNCVLYTPAGDPKWSTNTAGQGGSDLVVQDDGNLVVYNGVTPKWASDTMQTTPSPTRVPVARPWAVILCRFADETPDSVIEAPIESFFRKAFTPGTGGLVEYWRDVSLDIVDIGSSHVFGWTTVDIKRADAGYPPVRRGDLTNAAIRAVQRDGQDPLTGYFTQLSVYRDTETQNHQPIDGSTDGLGGRTNLTPPFNGNITAHEMGHSLGMNHDSDDTGKTEYPDPACIMSGNGSFTPPGWSVRFGPALCLPHLLLQGWMEEDRILYDNGQWAHVGRALRFELTPIATRGKRAHFGASLLLPGSETDPKYYLLEYVTASGWNVGVAGMPYLMIRRITPSTDLGPTPDAMYLHAIHVEPSGVPTTWRDNTSQLNFTVSLVNTGESIVSVLVTG